MDGGTRNSDKASGFDLIVFGCRETCGRERFKVLTSGTFHHRTNRSAQSGITYENQEWSWYLRLRILKDFELVNLSLVTVRHSQVLCTSDSTEHMRMDVIRRPPG